MHYKRIIEDFKNGTLNKEKVTLVIDNDDSYWKVEDESLSEYQVDQIREDLQEKYGGSNGYSDMVDVLVAAGVNAEWC